MGKIRPPEPAFLFVGTLYSDPQIYIRAQDILEREFGDILLIGPSMPWIFSTCYREELGPSIERRFIFFKDLFDTGTLADIKLKTNKIEDSFSVGGKRRINIDPGYITLAKLVLASTKNYSHRVHLGQGIYGEVTLIYSEKEASFKPHLFTYRDYQEKDCLDMFLNVRKELNKMRPHRVRPARTEKTTSKTGP